MSILVGPPSLSSVHFSPLFRVHVGTAHVASTSAARRPQIYQCGARFSYKHVSLVRKLSTAADVRLRACITRRSQIRIRAG